MLVLDEIEESCETGAGDDYIKDVRGLIKQRTNLEKQVRNKK